MSEAKRYWADIGMSQDDQADNPNENVFTLMVKAEDYDALRAEVAKAGERIETMRQVLGLRDEQMLTLRAEVERLEALVGGYQADNQRLFSEGFALTAEVERLRAALRLFVRAGSGARPSR